MQFDLNYAKDAIIRLAELQKKDDDASKVLLRNNLLYLAERAKEKVPNVRRVQACYKDLDTFLEAYVAVYNGFSTAAFLTGFQAYAAATGDSTLEGACACWDYNLPMNEVFNFELNSAIVFDTGKEASWLKGEVKDILPAVL